MERKRIIRSIIYIGLACCFVAIVAAVVWLIQAGRSQAKRDEQESEGVSYVQAQEEKDAAQAQAVILAARESRNREETASGNSEIDIDPTGFEEGSREEAQTTALSEEQENKIAVWQEQIRTGTVIKLTDEQKAYYRGLFTKSNCIVFGDSMAQAALDYDFLESIHVVYRRGYAIGQMDEALEEVAALLPEKVIFFTGLNDANYYSTALDYARVYGEKIAYLRSMLPQVEVYVCSMIPPSDALAAVRADLARAPEYDAALEQMCKTQDITYIDIKWMVTQELYMPDGIHFTARFYDIWLQYVAMIAKL